MRSEQQERRTGDGSDRLTEHLERLGGMPLLYRRFRASATVAQLFAAAADAARELCGFDRAIVLVVGGGALTADDSDALPDAESDRLRRRVQAAPVMLAHSTLEAELIRDPRRATSRRPSLLAQSLELAQFAITPIAPDGHALALLVADRAAGAVDDLDHAALATVAMMTGVALEHVVLHARIAEVSAELTHLTSSAQALMSEVLQAPLTVPTARGGGDAFPPPRAALGTTGGLLTAREEQIAALLVEGRSNREIGEQLLLSSETVKDYVMRLRRKLNAANRVDAASRYLRLTQAQGAMISG
ncbi:MAG: liaR 1 [Solirubrobacterales bacterium]|nr:liaR 1 [Solirubrobacterales bacterium]